jgi:hypothetical protein
MDDTLQSTSPGAGDLGHFMNRGQWYNFSSSPENPHLLNHSLNPSKTGERDLEEAVRNGAFIPSAGYWIPGWVTLPARSGIQSKEMGYVSGVLNAWQTVNSDGYIYRHPENPSDGTWEDTSAGLVVSSIRDTSIAGGETSTAREGAKELRYILRVTKDQWRVMDDIFGGIGTMGLHGIDWDKTVEKLGAGPFLQASSTHVPGGNFTSLYNLGNPSQNPVFKLFSKKVLFPPGLHIDYSTTDYVTIIWKIKL